MLGYYNHKEEEEKAIHTDQNGVRWFATGDLARIAESIGKEVLPKYFEFHEELLYTANGKIDFSAMRARDIEKMGRKIR